MDELEFVEDTLRRHAIFFSKGSWQECVSHCQSIPDSPFQKGRQYIVSVIEVTPYLDKKNVS